MMSTKRKLFYQQLGRWWQLAAMEGYDWSQPDTPEALALEQGLWESKELYESGEIKLSEVRDVFEAWVLTHRKLQLETAAPLTAMRTHRRKEARA